MNRIQKPGGGLEKTDYGKVTIHGDDQATDDDGDAKFISLW